MKVVGLKDADDVTTMLIGSAQEEQEKKQDLGQDVTA
jgi:hypothetical protein